MSSNSRKTLSRQNLEDRCAVLADVISALRPVYLSKKCNATQQQLIETIIGAAIWYIPQPDSLWTGMYSMEAIKAMGSGQKLSRDHHYPRKIAALELLSNDSLTAAEMLRLYEEKYGKFNFVSRLENRKLMRFQRVGIFKNPEDCYARAGVQLVRDKDLNSKVSTVLGRKSSSA